MSLSTLNGWFSESFSDAGLENFQDIYRFEISMYNIKGEEYQWQTDKCTCLKNAV
jgi:hypothetical protein